MKRTWILILFAFTVSFAQGQITNLSGVVNTYHKVNEIIPSKACLIVEDTTGLRINNLVMVVQMKGATIETSTTSIFGDTTSLGGAGSYEIGTICYIIDDSVFLFHELLNNYDVNSKVQLVQFAECYSCDVVDTVKALSWDNTTGLGGVIAIFADQDITLNAPVYADWSGYSGGAYILSNGTCSNVLPATLYAYDASNTGPQNGAYKGEGVAELTALITGGRGAPANGGGGGNNHNNSGGGGANLTAGGLGGGNSSTMGCRTTLRGLGGKALSSWSGKKIFPGGGGGAGQANNGFTVVNGGNGGGIIFIWANNLVGNNELISTNGGNGGDSQSDGAGGGGAGGTIIMHVASYTGNTNISASGGDGGNSADGGTIGRCYGGGGGGSGGALYFTGSIPVITITTNGGANGVESGRDPGCNPEQAALPGSNGQTISNYDFSRSTNPAGYCRLLLPSKLLFFKAQKVNRSVVLNWQVDYPALVKEFMVEKRTGNGGWTSLPAITADDNRFKYAAVDNSPSQGDNFYRLKISEKDGSIQYSEIRKIWFGSPAGDFTIFPNPSAGKVTLSGNFESNTLLQVTDISGKIVWQQYIRDQQVRIDLPHFAAGLYLVRYRDAVKKLLVK